MSRTPDEWDRVVEWEGQNALATTAATLFENAAMKCRQHNSPGHLVEAQAYAVEAQQYLDELRRRKGRDAAVEQGS